MEQFIFCLNHPSKYAKRICRQCDVKLCNSCSIDFHSDHINLVESLNLEFVKEPIPIINKFIENSESKLLLMNRCMYFIFHEAHLYCRDCSNFICDKCIPSHLESFKSHKVIRFTEYFENLRIKANLLSEILLFQSKEFIDKNKDFLKYSTIIYEKNNLFDSSLTRLFSLKLNIEESFKLIKNLYFNLYQKIFEFYRKNQKKQLLDVKKLTQFQKIHDQLRFENDKNKVAFLLMDFEQIINELIGDEEFNVYIKLMQEENNIKLLLQDSINQISCLEEEFLDKLNTDINNVNNKVQSVSSNIKNYIKNNLKFKDIEIDDLFKHCKRQTNYYNQSELNIKNKILFEEYNKRNEQIKDQRFNRIEKEIVFSENMNTVYSKKTSLKSLPSKPETFFHNSDIVIQQHPSKKFTFMKNIDEKEEVNLSEYSKGGYYDQTASITNTNLINKDEDYISISLNKQESDSNANSTKNLKTSEGLIKVFDLHTINENNENNETGVKSSRKIRFISYDTDLNDKQNNQSQEDLFFNTKQVSIDVPEVFTSKTPIITKPREMKLTEKEFINLNRDMSGYLLKQSNKSLFQKSLYDKINKIQLNLQEKIYDQKEKLKFSAYKDILIDSFSDKELSNLESFSVGFNCKSIFCFNFALDKIFEFEFEYFKFPIFHSTIYSAPFIYLSGGKDSSNNKEEKSFYQIKRVYNQNYSFCYDRLCDMIFARSNHLMISVYNNRRSSFINSTSLIDDVKSIYAISGTNTNSCEQYSFDSSKWIEIPALTSNREKASGLLFNDEYLYIFLGYDKLRNKFSGSLERISITKLDKWEELIPNTKLSLLKKHSVGLIYNSQSTGNIKEILIIGGINAMRNQSKEVYIYNVEYNSLVVSKEISLPESSSFHNTTFSLCSFNNSLFSSFNEDLSFVLYDKNKKEFKIVQ